MDKELIIGRKYLDRIGQIWVVTGHNKNVFRPYTVQRCTDDPSKYGTVQEVTRHGAAISDMIPCYADLVKEYVEEIQNSANPLTEYFVQTEEEFRQEFIDNAAIKIMGVLEYNDNTVAAKQAYCLAEELWEERKRRANK